MPTWFARCATALVLLAVALPAGASNVVFVGDFDQDGGGDGEVPENAAADDMMFLRMSNVLGHNVTKVDDALVTATAVAGADFIVVSATASSGTFADNDSGDGNSGATNALATDATIVLMEGGNAILSAFDLNGGMAIGPLDGTSIDILSDDGYVTQGFAPGPLTIFSSTSTIATWGTVPPQAANLGFPQIDFQRTILATVPDDLYPVTDVAIGTHTIGDNEIVCLPFHNASFTQANANGLQLFDNALIPEPSTWTLLIVVGAAAALLCLRRKRTF
jgi:hypothetical protein